MNDTVAAPNPDTRLLTGTFALACAMQLSGSLACALYILFPLYVRHLGGTEVTIGLFAGLGAVAAVAVRWPLSVLLDRYGRKPAMVAATALHAATSLAFLFLDSFGIPFALAVILSAMCMGAMFTSFVTYAADIVPFARRAQGLAWFGVWGMAANGIGPLLGEWLQTRAGFSEYFLAAAGCAAASGLIASTLPDRHRAEEQHRQSPSASGQQVDRRFGLLLGLTLLFGVVEASVFTFLAPFVTSVAGSGAGKVLFAYAMAAVTVRVVSSHLPDRLGRLPVLAASFFLYGSALLALPFLRGEAWLLSGVLAGIGHGYAFPILAALVVDLAGGRRGRAVSWFTAMFDVGHSLGNPALGAIAEHAGYRTMYTTVGALALAGAALIVTQRARFRPHSPTSIQ
jgi:predicted MFS family arabinose efflux permease